MRAARYRFLTTWQLEAPREAVWEAIHDVERWPDWWPGVELVEKLSGGDEDSVGTVYRHCWRSALPYTVTFDLRTTRVERPAALEADVTGELRGTGRWRLHEGAFTTVTYEWNVETTRAWMNALAPVGRPVFAWSHDHVMRRGGEALATLLGARLVTNA